MRDDLVVTASRVYELFHEASMRTLTPRRTPACDHVKEGRVVGYWCLCCDDAAFRCLDCHIDHLSDVCPACGAQLDPDVQHLVKHTYEGDRSAARPLAGRIVYGWVCASCAMDNDLAKLLDADS